MQYYIFEPACATKATGPQYPQIQKWKPGYNYDDPKSYYSYYSASNKGSIIPDFAPNLDALILHNSAKPTDLLSSGLSIGYFVSKKLKQIFEQFKFPPHHYYPAEIIHKGARLGDYYFIHIVSNYFLDYLDDIDYEKSIFIKAGIDKTNPELIELYSKSDYLNKAKELQHNFSVKNLPLKSIFPQKIVFNEKFDKDLDYFSSPFRVEKNISDKLYQALVNNNITGYETRHNNILNFTDIELNLSHN